MEISTWIRGARLKTLPLAIAPVVIGAALSWRGVFLYSQGGDIWHEPCPFFGGQHDLSELKFGSLVGECQRSAGWFILVAVLCGCVALFLQVAANFANDYSDGIRGTDEGRAVDSARSFAKTPSAESTSTPEALPASQSQHGPARLVASGVSPKKVLAAAGINALIACLCGLAVVTLTGYWWFILVGIACLVAGWCYVGGKHPYGYHYLGEIFVFIFFGLVVTCGTMFALAGTISTEGMLGGANVGLIAVAVLCVNNLRDVETDRTHGKHTWMTALSRRNGTVFAIALLSVAVLLLAAYILLLSTPAMQTIAILAVTCAMCAAAAVAIARKKYGEALPLIRKAVEGRAPYMDRLQYFSETLLRGTEIIQAAGIARPLVGKDNRLDSSKLESVKKKLEAFYKDYSPSTDRKIAKRMFGILRDSIAPEHLPSSFVVIEEQFGGDVDAYVDYVYDNSAFADRSRAEALLASPTVEALLNDPAYKMRREVVKTYNALIDPINSFSEDFARGHRLYVAGLMEMDADRVFYPDANFTMRLTYGQVLPYEPQDAVSYNYFTTLDGVIAKEDPENAYEFSVPEKLKELYRTKDYGPYAEKGVLHVGFISNNDITGGNSGSPVMNAKGQLIGLAFDGNWEAMSGDIAFEPALQRTISVDIRYVLFIIDKYAGATRLIDEMTIVR